jgi:hypothetical protein
LAAFFSAAALAATMGMTRTAARSRSSPASAASSLVDLFEGAPHIDVDGEGFDLVEVAPPYDTQAQVTAPRAADLAYEMLTLRALAA